MCIKKNPADFDALKNVIMKKKAWQLKYKLNELRTKQWKSTANFKTNSYFKWSGERLDNL